MRARWLVVPALLGAAAVAYATVGRASTGPATIRITDRQLVYKRTGSGVGGREVVRSSLFQRSNNTHAIGHSATLCTYVAREERICSTVYTLPKGTIVVGGALFSRLLYELAVVGGTGFYDNARGTLTATVIGLRPRRELLLFRLTG